LKAILDRARGQEDTHFWTSQKVKSRIIDGDDSRAHLLFLVVTFTKIAIAFS
jgi:hypothetical protein